MNIQDVIAELLNSNWFAGDAFVQLQHAVMLKDSKLAAAAGMRCMDLARQLEKAGTKPQPPTEPKPASQCQSCGQQITGLACPCQMTAATSGYETVAPALPPCSWCGSHIPPQDEEQPCDHCRPQWIEALKP